MSHRYIFQPAQPIPGYNLPIGAAPAQRTLAVKNDAEDPRPAVVQPGNLKVFQIPGKQPHAAAAATADASGR